MVVVLLLLPSILCWTGRCCGLLHLRTLRLLRRCCMFCSYTCRLAEAPTHPLIF